MGVVKHRKNKTKNEDVKTKEVANGKTKHVDGKVKKKKLVSCLQCIKPVDDGGLEGKYRVAAPELMQDTFMSDSEDEGGEVECPIQQQQQYRYMNSEAGTLHRAKPLEDSVTDGHLWPSNNDRKVATMERQPLDIGFLVSFVVDARGGAMKAKRRGGVRIIVPPAACAAPTRVTCRAASRRAPVAAPPPLMEGEALASRLLELQPQGAKFLAPVIIEVPIFTSSSPDREIVVLRSDTGETWQDHYLHNNDNSMIQEAVQRERQEHGGSGEALGEGGERVTRVVTCDFPHYLAVVSRVRQEVHVVGPDGGTVSSAHIPQVQAQFPAAALTKRIRVGLQAQGAAGDLVRRVLPRSACVSPVVTVEPRRRKFHRTITLTVPLPQSQGGHERPAAASLRLLCSIMGGQARAVWEDVTGSTPLTLTEDCASFTTTVSARFWLMNCQNVSDATKLATELYREMLLVPFDVRIVVLGKRLDALEGRLLVMYITDRYAYDTLLQQEHYTEVAHSTSVRFLDSKEVFLEFSGNLVPVTKSGSQPMFTFEAFKDNRVEFTVRVKHHEERPTGRIYFMNEPKVAKGEQSQTPACVLDVELPDSIAPRAGKSQVDYLNLDQSGFDALKDELSFHWGDHNNSLGPASLPYHHDKQVNGHDKIITNGDVKYPTKDSEDKVADKEDVKPQVNGDTLHVDSNKTKATFDSDEDKTPQNTLEKGKKKSEGGSFLGGLADKVKNVFGHSEDKEDEKETKPQPKPRESKEKEKTPPKPAPRIINEDLLGKVDDMFKDLHTKPNQLKDDDDIESHVYATKLVVDEGDKPALDKTEDLYDMYANMQPVDTPLYNRRSDPFQFYVGCCEGKFAKDQKHRHEETSNLADRIEQVNFTTHETLQEVAEKSENDVIDGLNKLKEEKDSIEQKSGEVTTEVFEKYEKAKGNLKDKAQGLKLDVQNELQILEDAGGGKWEEFTDSTQTAQKNFDDKASELQTNVTGGIENVKSSATDVSNNVAEKASIAKEDFSNKIHELDFAAREKAEELKNRGHEKYVQFKDGAESTADKVKQKAHDVESDIKDKAKDGANAMADAAHNVQEGLNHKAQDVEAAAEETVDSLKEDLSDSINSAKGKSKKAKKEAKKKAKEGKNFFTGLVHNIFGEKDKIEDEVKGKLAETKESANNLLDQASAKKNELQSDVEKAKDGLKDRANEVASNIENKADDIKKAARDKKNEIEKSVQDKNSEIQKSIEEQKSEVEKAVQGKKDEAKKAFEDTSEGITSNVHEKANEVRDKAEESRNAILNKTGEIKDSIVDKSNDIKNAAYDTALAAKTVVHNKASEVKNTVHETAAELSDKANEVKDAIRDKTNQAKDGVVAKTTDMKDAVQEKTVEATAAVQNKAAEVTGAIASKVSETKDAIHDKTVEIKDGVANKVSDASNAILDKSVEVKDAFTTKVSDATTAVHDKSIEIKDAVATKLSDAKDSIHDKTVDISQTAATKVSDARDNIQGKTNDVKDVVCDTASDAYSSVQEKTQAVGSAIKNKTNEIGLALSNKKDEAQSEMDRIRQEAELTTEEIKKTAEEKLNAAADKNAEIQANVETKFEDLQKSGKEVFANIQQAASDEATDLQRSSKQAFDHVQDSTLSTFDRVESSAKDRVNETRDTWEDLQSSAGDTYANFKDDVHSVGNSAQDTLHSFQSSAGNTFDSLDDSAREYFGDVKSNVEGGSKQLFSNAKDSFEGFQVSADNKLEDVRGSAKERLDEAGARLGGMSEEVVEGARGAEQAVVDTVASEADKFTSSLNDLGNSVFGSSGKGFMKDSSTKLLESEKSTAEKSSPHKKSSGIPKLRRKK